VSASHRAGPGAVALTDAVLEGGAFGLGAGPEVVRGAGAPLDRGRERGIGCAEFGHSGAKPRGVERVDREGPMAALGAADAAGERRTGAARGFSQQSVHNLHKLSIARGKVHKRKHSGSLTRRRKRNI
jgi:hypothetical protein